MSRIVVLGATGMLGHKACQLLRGHEIFGFLRKPVSDYAAVRGIFEGVTLVGDVDVFERDRLEMAIREVEPDIVVNGIGLVKQLERAADPYEAVGINAFLPHRLARLCARIGTRLVHISTDCVFDGRRGSYRESDLTDAEDLYGRSKALGETGAGEGASVTLRTSFIGRELAARKHGLLEWFLAQDGRSVRGFTRAIYTGLTSIELSRVIERVVATEGLCGLYQVASEPISKYDLLCLVRQVYGLDIEIEAAEQPVCDRSLVGDAFSAAVGYVAPSWQDMIHDLYHDPTPYDTSSNEPESDS